MAFEELQKKLGSEATDIKENLILIRNCKELSKKQTAHAMLSVAFTIKNPVIINHIREEIGDTLSEEEIKGNKIGSILMGMNNVYFRFTAMTDNKDIQNLKPNLKMRGLRTNGLPVIDFEIISLAASCIGVCEHCINWHTAKLIELGVSIDGIQSVGRIAAVLKAVDTALFVK